MRNLKHLIAGCSLLLLSAIAVGTVGATWSVTIYNSGSFGCASVRFSYTATGSPANFRAVDGDDQVVSNTVLGQATGTHTITLTLSPAQEAGTTLQIQLDHPAWTNFGPATACSDSGDDIVLPPPPPWEHFGGENAYAAFRFFEDGTDNPVLIFLRVSNEGEGGLLFYLSKKMLERDYPCTGAMIHIYSSDDGLYHLRRLPTCELQANVGPDFEGKTHVMGFSSIPPGDDVYFHTFFSGGPIMRWFERDTWLS